jgi:hypothetical protein
MAATRWPPSALCLLTEIHTKTKMSTKSLAWPLPLFGRNTSASRSTNITPHRTAVLARASRPLRRSRFANLSANFFQYLAGALVVATAVMLVLYVFGINQSAAKGYEITKQRNKLNALMEDNKKLLVRTAEAGSILQIRDEAAANHLVQITNQEYLQITQLSQR